VGYTVYGVEEIGQKGNSPVLILTMIIILINGTWTDKTIALKISWPMRYSVYSENGQKFTCALFEAIRLPNQPASVVDIYSGLEKVPDPFVTLRDRCLAVVFAALIAIRNRAYAAAERRVGAPVRSSIKYGSWGRDVMMSCSFLALLAVSVFLQVAVVFFFLAGDRDLLKASRELRKIADAVTRFDGYGLLGKDHDKII
jgi:hypothetical protein